MRGRLTIGCVAVSTVALALVAVAAAENYQYKIVAADHTLASHIALNRADLGGLSGWAGGPVKPDRTPETESDRCKGYLPKESDLVVTGDAETRFSLRDTTLDTSVQVFQTAAMVATDWHRNVDVPNFLTCFRQAIAKSVPGGRVNSVTRLPVSTAATKTVAVRTLVTRTLNGASVRVAFDVVVFYRGRAEVTVLTAGGAPRAIDLQALSAVDRRIAAAVVAKMPAS